MRRIYLVLECLFIAAFLGMLVGCKTKSHEVINDSISEDSVLQIVSQWKSDTSGCFRLRHPDKIQFVIDKFDLIGKDSTILIKFLGKPNAKLMMGDTACVFYYFMDCSRRYRVPGWKYLEQR